jgi:antitoxin YokJ
MNIAEIIKTISETSSCLVYPVENFPIVQPGHIIPEDIQVFYKVCGGANLFIDSAFPTVIVPPNKFIRANQVIFSHADSEQLANIRDDISWSWYLVGIGRNSQYITVDLDPVRLGNVYDSFWDKHPRDSTIISKSFSDLLLKLLESRGEYYFWDVQSFISLGSPYK